MKKCNKNILYLAIILFFTATMLNLHAINVQAINSSNMKVSGDDSSNSSQSNNELWVSCENDIVYANKENHWNYTLDIIANSKGIKICQIDEMAYDSDELKNTHIINEAQVKDFLKTDNFITGKIYRRNFGRNVGNVNRIEYIFKGTNSNNEGIICKCTVNLSKEQKSISQIEASVYDTNNLRYNANFNKKVADGVNWVPTNVLGKCQYTKDEILNFGKEPEVLQDNIKTVYDAIQYIQAQNFESANDNIRSSENNITWEHHKPGEEAIRTNKGCCATIAALVNYLLKGDYDEVGYIGYSRSDGSGHVFNYIKQDGIYYFMDYTHQINEVVNKSVVGMESGDLNDYYKGDFIARNLHMAKNPMDYVKYYMNNVKTPPVLWEMYSLDSVLPISNPKRNNKAYIYFPNNVDINILYDDPNDDLILKRVDPPTKFPDWNLVN